MKAVYALVFVLFSFAAPAQTLETSIAAYLLDDLDCLGETSRPSTTPAQMIAIELLCAAMFDEVDVAIMGPEDAEDLPVGTTQPIGNKNSTEKNSTGTDDKQMVNDPVDQGAMSDQIVTTEPTIEKLGETMSKEADDVAITGREDAKDVPVGTTQPGE